MSLACSILKSAAIQLANSAIYLRPYRGQVNFLEGCALGGRDAAINILRCHLMDCPKGVRKEVGQTIRRHLNIGGARMENRKEILTAFGVDGLCPECVTKEAKP